MNRGLGLSVAAAIAALGLVMTALHAQAPAKPGAASKPTRFVDLYGEIGRSRETPQGTISTLSNNVRIVSEDTTLRTDAATYNNKTQIATSPGRVQIDDPQNTIVGNTGIAYYKTRTAQIRGDVRITVRPRPADANAREGSLRRDFKEPVAITCDRVDYNWRTRVAVATGNLVFRQKDRTVTAERAVYEGRQERLTLTGNVRGVTKNGGEARGEKAVAILTEGAETLEFTGITTLRVPVEDDGEETPLEPVTTPEPVVTPDAPPARPVPDVPPIP